MSDIPFYHWPLLAEKLGHCCSAAKEHRSPVLNDALPIRSQGPQHSSTRRRKAWICIRPARVGQPLPAEHTECFPATYRTHFFKSCFGSFFALYPQKTEMIQPAYSKGKCLNFSSYERLSCKGRQLSISSFWLKQLLTSLFLAEGFGLNHDWNTSCALSACFVWTATLLGRGCKETLVQGWPEPL